MGSQLNVICYLNLIRPTDAIQSKHTSSVHNISPGPDLHWAAGLVLPGPSAKRFLLKLSKVVNGHSPLAVACVPALLDFAEILQLLTVNKSSKITIYIWFTVNYCNTHCIMGIFY